MKIELKKMSIIVLCLCTSIHGVQHSSSESESSNERSSDECLVEMKDISQPNIFQQTTNGANQTQSLLPLGASAYQRVSQRDQKLVSAKHTCWQLLDRHEKWIWCLCLLLGVAGISAVVGILESDCFGKGCKL